MEYSTTGFAIVACLLILTLVKLKNFIRMLFYGSKIPGPYLGNTQLLMKLRPELLFKVITDVQFEMGETFKIFVGPNLWVYLYSPEEVRQALNDVNLSRPAVFDLLNILLGDGLLVSKGEKWRLHRKKLTPSFHPTVLGHFPEAICRHADKFCDLIERNSPIEISNKIFLCVLDLICETSLGAQINSQMDETNSYAESFHLTSHLLYLRIINPLLSLDAIYNLTGDSRKLRKAVSEIHKLTLRCIEERRQENLGNDFEDEFGIKRKRSLLDTLLSCEDFTMENIKDEVNTFLFAGVDTTTASMCFILWALGKHQEKQQKLYEEIKLFCGRETEISIPDINQMIYLDYFIKECQRMYTIVPLTGRQVHRSTKIGRHLLPKGSVIWINNYALANSEEYFEDPHLFNPERFSNLDSGKKSVYLPFGGGLRECIGKKYAVLMMKILTAKIILNFRVQLKHPDETLELISEMSLKSKNGFNLIFKDRS